MKKLNRREFIKLSGVAIAASVLGFKAVVTEPTKAAVADPVTYENVEDLLRRMTESAARASEYIYLFGNEAVSTKDSCAAFAAAVNRFNDQREGLIG